ncbi:MAG: site-specific integrase [Bryobacteraceae bacterium]
MTDAAVACGPLQNSLTEFLNFCRIERGLSINSLEAYKADLQKMEDFCARRKYSDIPDASILRSHIDALYQAGLGSRSVARHLSTLRNFYKFLLREGRIATDPTELLGSPKQWQTIPKFLNLEEIDRLIQAPDTSRPTGLQDNAMVELLYAAGLDLPTLPAEVLDVRLDLGVLRLRPTRQQAAVVPVGELRGIVHAWKPHAGHPQGRPGATCS